MYVNASQYSEHHVPIDRIESFFEVDKCNEERGGVNVGAIHDASQDMNLLDAASTSAEASLVLTKQ